jgi:hypothetical protein
VQINNTNLRPIPPSGITRISLWRNGMERPRIVSRDEFRNNVSLMLDEKSVLYQHIRDSALTRETLFNFSAKNATGRFGYVPVFKGEHDSITSPNKTEKPYKGVISPDSCGQYPPSIMLTHEDRSVFSGPNEKQDQFHGFIVMARFMAENAFPTEASLDYGTILDLDMLNQTAENLLFQGSIKTLGDLARQVLPQDILACDATPSPQLFQNLDAFSHVEHYPERKVSFGFNIISPARFPYPASAVSAAVKSYLESTGWALPARSTIIAQELSGADFKDGKRMIHIIFRHATEFSTELSFCIKRTSESTAEAPIKGLMIFCL